MLLRLDGQFIRRHFARHARPQRRPHHQRLGHRGRHDEIDRLLPPRLGRRKRFPQPGRERRVVGLPDELAGLEHVQFKRVLPKRQLHLPGRRRLDERPARLKDLEHAAAAGLVARRPAVEGHAVAAFDAAGEIDQNAALSHGHHRAQPHAPLRARGRRHEHLVVAALEPAGGKPPRERQLHFLDVAGRKRHRPAGDGAVDRRAVVPRDVGHIFGGLEPPFDLERRHARRDQFGRQRVGREVLRREQILLIAEVDVLAVADEVVGQPAGLGALAAVGAAAAE